MDCTNCNKLTGNYNKDKSICGRCREVLKIDIALSIRGEDRVYLSERNRNTHGRKGKLTATEKNDIYWANKRDGRSMRRLVEEYGVSLGTICNTIRAYKGTS